jgi:heat shock protein 5
VRIVDPGRRFTLTRLYSGKSESITITNEKGRLSQEEIDRMVREAEQFAAEDEAQRKRIEALNSLSSFVYGLKSQLGDQEGLGGKIEDEDKKTILAAVKETTDWIDANGSSASVEELEEKLSGSCCLWECEIDAEC